MKKKIIYLTICILVLTVLVFYNNMTSNMANADNNKANEFVYLDSDGESVNYKASKNTNRILFVISDTCDSCRDSLKWLSDQNDSTQNKIDLVSLSGISETKKLIEKYDIKSKYYIDNNKSTVVKLRIDSIPMVVLTTNGVYEKTSLSIQAAVKNGGVNNEKSID